jgi:hypothetical protein
MDSLGGICILKQILFYTATEYWKATRPAGHFYDTNEIQNILIVYVFNIRKRTLQTGQFSKICNIVPNLIFFGQFQVVNWVDGVWSQTSKFKMDVLPTGVILVDTSWSSTCWVGYGKIYTKHTIQ